MSPTEFKDLLHDAMRGPTLDILELYITDLMTTKDPEVRRKGLAYFTQVIGAEADKKTDPVSNLPSFNITINGGATQMQSITQDAMVIDMELDALLSGKRHHSINRDLIED